ncbi:MAG: hypothetical protein M1816_005318 [Peltula sp. TS41687]|nr:MAG: hypothetical protein M1816_005318 [Peltula sp. TS41687]
MSSISSQDELTSADRQLRQELLAIPLSPCPPLTQVTPIAPRVSIGMKAAVGQLIPTFRGVRPHPGEAQEYLDTIEFVVSERQYHDDAREATACRILFRAHLKDDALKWYQDLAADVQADYQTLRAQFLTQYGTNTKSTEDDFTFTNQVMTLRQGTKSIAQYVDEAEELSKKAPTTLSHYLARFFVAGLAEDSKLDRVQMYLGTNDNFTFAEAKAAVVRAYSRIGRPSPFDKNGQSSAGNHRASPDEVNAEILQYFKNLNQQMLTGVKPHVPMLGGNRAPLTTAELNTTAVPPRPRPDIRCHNCLEWGHFSTSCTLPQVSWKQKQANRTRIKEEARNIAAPAAVAQLYRNMPHRQATDPIPNRDTTATNNGDPLNSRVLPAAPAILQRVKTDNLVLPVMPALHARKRGRVHSPNASFHPGAQALPVQPLNDQPDPPRMGRPAPAGNHQTADQPAAPNQRAPMLDTQNTNTVPTPSIQPTNNEPQTKTNPARKTARDLRETIPINIAASGPRFDIKQFLKEATVTLPVYQLLDRSPQIRAQMARALQSSKPTRRGKKPAAAINAAHLGVPTITAEAFDEEEDTICLYIRAWVGNIPVDRTLVDTGAVVELVSPDLVNRLGNLQVYDVEDGWYLKLANDKTEAIKKYVWLPVNVAGVLANIKAYVFGRSEMFDLLLSKKWMYRVRAVEDHGAKALTVQGTDGRKFTVTATIGESIHPELMTTEVEDLDEYLADDELARLNAELDDFDYEVDHADNDMAGKAKRL